MSISISIAISISISMDILQSAECRAGDGVRSQHPWSQHPRSLAEEAGMVFPKAEAVLEEEVTAANDGLEELTVPELRERERVLGVVPAGTDREKRRPWWAVGDSTESGQSSSTTNIGSSSGSSSSSSSNTCCGRAC
jgi:hypothetical protein